MRLHGVLLSWKSIQTTLPFTLYWLQRQTAGLVGAMDQCNCLITMKPDTEAEGWT
jgi:hypothetical protein